MFSDLQSEFEKDRQEYLDTIRSQDQQLILLQTLIDKVQPTLRKDCNYRYSLTQITKGGKVSNDLLNFNLKGTVKVNERKFRLKPRNFRRWSQPIVFLSDVPVP